MALFVIVHGAWSGGFSWRSFAAKLAGRGHVVYTPTLTGQGERAHLARPEVDLDTHIRDVLGVLEFEDLRDVVLVGHSYGGMVVTGVADRARDRIGRLVYIDAFVPKDGESLLSLLPAEQRAALIERVEREGAGWRLTPNPVTPDTPEEIRLWQETRRLPQPFATFTQPLRLESDPIERRTYIYCLRASAGDVFRRFADEARAGSGWTALEIDSTHGPHVTAPEELVELLERISS